MNNDNNNKMVQSPNINCSRYEISETNDKQSCHSELQSPLVAETESPPTELN